MVDILIGSFLYLVMFVAGLVIGFAARPYWERRRAEQAAERAKLVSREKRSASAKEAALRRANKMADGVGSLGGLNGSVQQHSKEQP